MKKKYVKIMFLSMVLLTTSVTATYAALPKDDKKDTEEVSVDTNLPPLMEPMNLSHFLLILRLYLEKKLK